MDEQTIKKLLARTKDQDIKDKLKATTQEAFELGVSHRRTYWLHHTVTIKLLVRSLL